MKKVCKIVIIAIIISFMLGNIGSFAATSDLSGLSQISNPTGVSSLTKASGKILGVIYAVATAVSIGMLIVIGIKYMTSSPDQKANLKSRAIPYIIGAVLIFGTANILKFIQKISTWIQA